MPLEKEDFVRETEEETAFREAHLTLFTFPPFNLAEEILPHLDAEIVWLRRHVEEGSVNGESLILPEKTVYIDLQPCPRFLAPYRDDQHLLSSVLTSARGSGNIPKDVLWGSNIEIKLPLDSRWSVSSDEIDSILLPQVKDTLKTKRKVRLPTVAEYLYLKSQGHLFNANQSDHSLATKEWANDLFYSAHDFSNPIGRLIVSNSLENPASGGVHWWFTQGDFKRLPTLGFRLVAEVK